MNFTAAVISIIVAFVHVISSDFVCDDVSFIQDVSLSLFVYHSLFTNSKFQLCLHGTQVAVSLPSCPRPTWRLEVDVRHCRHERTFTCATPEDTVEVVWP